MTRFGRARTRSNLPAALTSFVGRAREIGALAARLTETRLLTLTGPGGVGKSRLALEIARELQAQADGDGWPAEVWLVELSGPAEPTQALVAVAAALGVRDDPGRSLVETLVDSLDDRALLLVLDNCEHLAEPTADLIVALLRGCPNVRVMVTSRVPLAISGEAEWRVAPLAVPDAERMPARAALTRYGAVRLFVVRARAARADFALTAHNAEDVVRICARLDGLPLAIELAAAQLKLLTPAEILAGLDDRFSLLVSTDQAALPRHRALGAALDWSYALLGDPERALFHRLAPFVGGWSVDVARALCAPGVPDESGRERADRRAAPAVARGSRRETVSLLPLARLVEHSLIVVEDRGQATRYRFLETIQRFAEERLNESGDNASARGWHLRRMLDLAWQARAGIPTAAQQAWCMRIDDELDNIRAALGWACEAPLALIPASEAEPDQRLTAIEATLRLAGALLLYWGDARGRLGEAWVWLERLLAIDRTTRGVTGPVSLGRIVALNAHGYTALMLLDAPSAEASFTTAEALAHTAGERFEEVFALSGQGSVALMTGDLDRAAALNDAALALARQTGIPFVLGGTLYWRGEVALAAGDAALAMALFTESLDVARAHDLRREGGITLGGMAKIAMMNEAYEQAAALLCECIAIAQAVEDPRGLAWSLEQLAWARAALGQTRQAASLLGTAATLFKRLGTSRPPFPQWLAYRERAITAARTALGTGAFDAAYTAGAALSTERAVELALRGGPGQHTTANLSRRERQVAGLVAHGLTNRQIADELVVREQTVANHLQRIYGKLGVSGRVNLAALVLEHGHVDRPRRQT